ncbi:unnamed protein product [Penicillium manginii]
MSPRREPKSSTPIPKSNSHRPETSTPTRKTPPPKPAKRKCPAKQTYRSKKRTLAASVDPLQLAINRSIHVVFVQETVSALKRVLAELQQLQGVARCGEVDAENAFSDELEILARRAKKTSGDVLRLLGRQEIAMEVERCMLSIAEKELESGL